MAPRRLAPSLLLLFAACGTRSVSGSAHEPSEKKAGPPPPPPAPARVIHLELEVADADVGAEPPRTRVSLVLTDQNGAAHREEIGEFTGSCSDATPGARGEPMSPVLALDCGVPGEGVKLRFVKRRNQLVVLRAPNDEPFDPLDYEPIKTLELPPGVAVTTDYGSQAPGSSG